MNAFGHQRAISIAILAMGGEGGGVLADWIVDAAERSGYYAQTTSVPGVAQRTGATIYYVELFPESAARAVGKDPVLSLMPVPGEVDVVIASELMEMGRAIQRGLVAPDRTTLIASTNRIYSMTEKIALGDGRVDGDTLLASGQSAAKRFIAADYARLAAESGSVISAALLGALARSEALPFPRDRFEEAIRAGGVGVESSVAAFNAAYRGTESEQEQPRQESPLPSRLASRIESTFPSTIRDVVCLGAARAFDFQDFDYATEYLVKVAHLLSLEVGHGEADCALTREAARYLALWMTYEDAIRVADLKIRRARFDRVRQEARASTSQVLRIHEYLHPSVQEIADILPRRIGERLLSSREGAKLINGYVGNGRIVETTSIRGFLTLYLLAGQRKRRRKSLRFQREHLMIEKWLGLVEATAKEDYALAVEVAQLPRLIKGYGETHQRGLKSYDALIATLPSLRGRPDAAVILKRLSAAALADDTGKQLADALQAVAA